MGRFLLIALASLVALAASPALAGAPVRSTGDQPYQRSPELQEYLDSLDAMEVAAAQAGEEAAAADEALRREKAPEIRAHDAQVDAWRKAHPAPAGTLDTLVHDSYDEQYNPERTELIYINRYQIPTHTVELGPDGQATGPVTQTQQGKAWETIGPKVSPGEPPGLSFGEDDDGDRTITAAEIPGPDGRHIVAKYEFNEDGVPWRGETFDPETGQRTGGFQDDRLKPKEPTLGGPLDVPPTVRLITGVCEKCRPLVNRHNDLANEINTRIVEMQSLSREHQHAYPRAQGPIRMRYEHLKAELAELMPQFEAARAEALACDKICREPQAALPDGVVRPALAEVGLNVPASFCSQTARVEFLNTVYNPAAAAALANSQAAQAYATRLNGLFTEYMRNEGGPIWAAIQKEMAEYKPIAEGAFAESNRINALYETIMAVPVADCPQLADNTEVPATGQPLTPVKDPKPGKPGKPDCPPEDRRKPIVVGPNGKVGSGARLKAKAASTAMGIAGGLLGSAAGLPGGGGGGGGGGPPTVVCKIKDGEMTVFNDPASGVSLKVGAKRAGGTVVVFADIAKSPDSGTFQTAFLENPQGEAMAPADVGICDLWGEWKLTVSWTKTTYVDGQVVSRESGGWAKAGRFVIPGTLSTVDKPDGLWKRLGFSNASHGARKIAMQYKLPAGGGPVDLIVHVTRPGEDPVTTAPFALRMVEGPNGFTFTKAPDADCPKPALVNVSNDAVVATPPEASNPPPQTQTRPPKPVLPPLPVENLFELEKKFALWKAGEDGLIDSISKPQVCPEGEEPIQNLFGEAKTVLLFTMKQRLAELDRMVPAGDLADGVREAIAAERKRLLENQARVTAMEDPGCANPDAPSPSPSPTEEPPREPSILDSIPEVPVIS